MGNVFKPLTKSDLIPLGLTAVATNVAFHKKKCLDQVLQH